MGAFWTLVAAVVALAAVCIGDLVSEEIRQRLDRLPHALIHFATRRLPDHLRAEQHEEWTAELHEVLRGAETLPITRLLRGTRFAAGLLRTAGDIGRQLATARLDSPAPDPPSRFSSRHVVYLLSATVFLIVLVAAEPLLGPGRTEGKNHRTAAPPGYTSVKAPTYSLAVPTGWTRRQSITSTFWFAPDALSKGLLVRPSTIKYVDDLCPVGHTAPASAVRLITATGSRRS